MITLHNIYTCSRESLGTRLIKKTVHFGGGGGGGGGRKTSPPPPPPPTLNRTLVVKCLSSCTADLEAVLRRIHVIPAETLCRVWHKDTNELLSDPSQTLSKAGIFSDMEVRWGGSKRVNHIFLFVDYCH